MRSFMRNADHGTCLGGSYSKYPNDDEIELYIDVIFTWLSERVAHFLWGRENATVPGLTPSSVSMVNTKCCPGPVLTSIWGQDYKYKQSSSLLINKSMSDLFIKIPGVDNGPVGHGEWVTGTFGHLHPPTRHCSGFDAWFWNLVQIMIHSSKLWFRLWCS